MIYNGEITWTDDEGDSTGTIHITDTDGTLKGHFIYDGHKYDLVFKQEKTDYFKVSIIYSGDMGGTAHLWRKWSDEKLILDGTWDDKWFGSFRCSATLLPSQ